jgi:hypothetical protein
MNTLAIIELILLATDLYFKNASMEGMTEEEAAARLHTALEEKMKRKAKDLPDV